MSSKLEARRAEERERRRQEIIDAADKVFDEDGFDLATMERIADRARVSRPLVYLPSEQVGAAQETCARALQRLHETSLASAARQGSGLLRLETILRAHLEFARQQPRCFCALKQSRTNGDGFESSNPAAVQAWDAVYAFTVECLQSGVTDGSIRANLGDPGRAALSLWGYVLGIAQLSWMEEGLLPQDGVSADRFTADAIDFFLRSLRPPAE